MTRARPDISPRCPGPTCGARRPGWSQIRRCTYSFAWLVHAAGGGIEQIRYLSVLFGVLTIPFAWALARRLGGDFAAAGAALLVASSARQIVASQDARGYTLLALAVLAALFCLVAARQASLNGARLRGRVSAWWGGYAVAATAALYTHNTAGLILFACNAAILTAVAVDRCAWRSFLRGWLIANLAVGLCFLLWLPVILAQSHDLLSTAWIGQPSLTYFRYQVMRVYGQPYVTIAQPFVDLAFLGVMLCGVVRVRASPLPMAIGVAIVAAGPWLMFAVSQWRPVIHSKTLLWAGPIALVLAARGCRLLGRASGVALALLVAVQLAAAVTVLSTKRDEGWRDMVAVLRAQARPGDAIYVSTLATSLLLRHYGWPEQMLVVRGFDHHNEPFFRAFPGTVVAPDDVAADARGFPRVWLFTRLPAGEHAAMAERIAAESPQVLDHRTGGLELSLFERPGS